MGGVIPTDDEARRINAAVRAYEASATSRLTSRGHVPKKRLRIEPAVASPGSTTNTIGNCPCTSAPGVITPTVTAKFSHRQAYRWKRTGLMSMLNDIDGFSLTSEPVAVWNTDTPTNSYISADITRTVGADSDVYVLTATEDSTHSWKLNFSIKSGASPNIADQIDWTEVCVSPNAPSPSKSNAVIVLDTETMTSEDGAYIDHPGCAGCLVPVRSLIEVCDGVFLPEYIGISHSYSNQTLNPANCLSTLYYSADIIAQQRFECRLQQVSATYWNYIVQTSPLGTFSPDAVCDGNPNNYYDPQIITASNDSSSAIGWFDCETGYLSFYYEYMQRLSPTFPEARRLRWWPSAPDGSLSVGADFDWTISHTMTDPQTPPFNDYIPSITLTPLS